jgi:hypothetical protein
MRSTIFLIVLVAATALAGPGKKANRVAPAPLVKAAKLLDGAARVDGTQRCTFDAAADGCTLRVKTSCKRKIGSTALAYWYTTEVPVGDLDELRTAAEEGAGDRPGTWGVLVFTTGRKITVVTDSGDRSVDDSVVIDFAQGKGAADRAKRLARLLLAARKECK